jgi:hypothetical protein
MLYLLAAFLALAGVEAIHVDRRVLRWPDLIQN